jgi:hypothetical protein
MEAKVVQFRRFDGALKRHPDAAAGERPSLARLGAGREDLSARLRDL